MYIWGKKQITLGNIYSKHDYSLYMQKVNNSLNAWLAQTGYWDSLRLTWMTNEWNGRMQKCSWSARVRRNEMVNWNSRHEQSFNKSPEMWQSLLLNLRLARWLTFGDLQVARQFRFEGCLQQIPKARTTRLADFFEQDKVRCTSIEMCQQSLNNAAKCVIEIQIELLHYSSWKLINYLSVAEK